MVLTLKTGVGGKTSALSDHAVTRVAATLAGRAQDAARAAAAWLVREQRQDGHWVGEFEGDTILDTEYILLMRFLGRDDREHERRLVNHVVRHWLNPDGGVPIYPGGPSEVSASVKVYLACKIAGHTPDEPFMQALRDRVLALGGVTACNTFTKLYLSIFGQYDWCGVPTIPPEVMLLPSWLPFNIYEIASWSRAILVPLAIINASHPHRELPPGCSIDELFVEGRNRKLLRLKRDRKLVTWHNFFLLLDRLLKIYDRSPVKPFRRAALRASERWMLERQDECDGLGAIFPAMTHAVMAYTCLGYPEDHPAVQHELRELRRFEITEGDETRMQPCLSPLWDTAIAVNALMDAGCPAEHPSIRRASDWLLAKQVRCKGDWSVRAPGVEPGGWAFEYDNVMYPDIDDTMMVLMALHKAYCPDDQPWNEAPRPAWEAMRRGLSWVLALQSRNGGWGAYDKDNTRQILQYVPFADHNAMLDPPSSDISARGLEMLSHYSYTLDEPAVRRALDFLWREQEADGSWYGRWGVNYVYGTWQALRGLRRIGVDMQDERVRRAVRWLQSVQNEDGGWGETCRSYDDPERYKARGPSTASQTAWAVMGLINAGEEASAEARLGVEYLLHTQRPDGTWDEPWFTGTGFPQVFYIRYHLYRHSFPLWALGQYVTATTGRKPALDLAADR